MTIPKNKSEALSLKEQFFFTGKPCKYGHIDKRYTNNGHCVQCTIDYSKSEKSKYIKKQYYNQIKESTEYIQQKHDYWKNYYKNNKTHLNDLEKKKYNENINYRIAKNFRNRLYKTVKGIAIYHSVFIDIGCDIIKFKCYIESQFQLGMSWDNYGEWHIDHIKPLSSFDLSNPSQYLLAVNYTNTQPLWATDNIKKGTK